MSGIGPISQIPTPALIVGPVDPRICVGTTAVVAINHAYLCAFEVQAPTLASNANVYVAASAGNIELGITDATGTVLATTGSVACPTVSTVGTKALTTPVQLVPGRRYFAYVIMDTGTAALIYVLGFAALNVLSGLGYDVAQTIPAGPSFTFGATGTARTYAIWFT